MQYLNKLSKFGFFLNNANKDVILFAGNLTSGGVAAGNLGTYPLILQGTSSAAPILQTLASTWSTLSAIILQQCLINSTNYFGLSPTQLASNAQASHYLTINGSKCVHVDSILALLVGMNKCMYNQLKAAGVSGFV